MSDDFERRLQEAFRGGSLPPAPASLVDALQRVPDAPVRSRRSTSGRTCSGCSRRQLLVATVGALAIGGGSPRPRLPTATVAPSSSPTPETGLRLEYQVLPSGGVVPGPADLATIVSIIERRIAATGAVGATVEADGADRIIVTLPGVTDADIDSKADRPDRPRRLRATRPDPGQRRPDARPHDGSRRCSAATRSHRRRSEPTRTDRPAIDFVLKPEGTRLFADYTAQNIGSYFAITLDGAVLSAPVIQNGIPGGEVQITGGGLNGFDANEAASLAAILQFAAAAVPDPGGRERRQVGRAGPDPFPSRRAP